MTYSVNPAFKTCQGPCGQRKAAAEYELPGPEDRVCLVCRTRPRRSPKPPSPPVPVPLGDGRTAIPLTGKNARGRAALVSDAKVLRVTGFYWRVMEQTRANGVKVGPYAVVRQGDRMIYMHALITGYKRTDHWDGDGLNNTDENLRDASQSQNMVNQGKGRRAGKASSQYKGVGLDRGRWRARIKVNYEERRLGRFATEEDAGRVCDLAALQVHGLDDRGRPMARLNFPFSDYGQDQDGAWRIVRPLGLVERLSPDVLSMLKEVSGDA